MMVESSPVGQSHSKGVVERAISSIVGPLRVLRDASEMRLNVKLPVNRPLLPWLVEHAALVLECFEGGGTANQRTNDAMGRRASATPTY